MKQICGDCGKPCQPRWDRDTGTFVSICCGDTLYRYSDLTVEIEDDEAAALAGTDATELRRRFWADLDSAAKERS